MNECPLPSARTGSPADAASLTAAEISASLRGRHQRAGFAVAVPAQFRQARGAAAVHPRKPSLPESIQSSAALVYCASMSVDQGGRLTEHAAPKSPDTQRLGALRARYDRATADLDPPLAIVDLGAFDRNAADMTRRAAGRPIRVATKSLRCRYLIERALATPGYRGVMCYSLPEALWLHAMGTSDDLLVAYPTVDRRALRALAADGQARQHITIMTDSEAHLDVVDRALGAATRRSGSAWNWTSPGGRWPASRPCTSAPGGPRCSRRSRRRTSPPRSPAARASAWSA